MVNPTRDEAGDETSMAEFERFRKLVLSKEHGELEGLHHRVGSLEKPGSVGAMLPEAISVADSRQSDALVDALLHPVERALVKSVETDRSLMASALFPILGPAIRLYVNELFRGMVDQLNESVKNATSLKQLRWRWEAKHAGLSYSEYVLLKTLSYSMDEVLLVQPDSGLLMFHVSRGRGGTLEDNPDLVSSMLVAIRSFAKDSFRDRKPRTENLNDTLSISAEDADLDRFSFGDNEIHIQTGPKAILAVVGAGTPPSTYRHLMGEVLENLHSDWRPKLANYRGDMASMEGCRPQLERLLIHNKGEALKKAPSWPFWLVAVVSCLGLAALLIYSSHWKQVWHEAVEVLRNEPGIEVIEVDSTGITSRKIRLLKDPEARKPETLVEPIIGKLDRVEFSISHYLSLEPEFEEPRARDRDRLMASLKAQDDQLAAEDAAAFSRLVRLEHLLKLRDEGDQYEPFLDAAYEEARHRSLITNLNPDAVVAGLFASRFPEVDAEITKVDGVWEVEGTVYPDEYELITKELPSLLADGAALSYDQLKQIPRPVEKTPFEVWKEKIEAVRIEFPSGTTEVTADTAAGMDRAVGLVKLLDYWALESGNPLPLYEIVALPLTGERVEGNLGVERTRLDMMRKELETAGVRAARITTRHESTPVKGRIGLQIFVVME